MDEYGSFEGVVTAADVLQAIVGDLRARRGRRSRAVGKARTTLILDGMTPVDELKVATEAAGPAGRRQLPHPGGPAAGAAPPGAARRRSHRVRRLAVRGAGNGRPSRREGAGRSRTRCRNREAADESNRHPMCGIGRRSRYAPGCPHRHHAEAAPALRRPAVPRLAAARVRPLRRDGLRLADRPSCGRDRSARPRNWRRSLPRTVRIALSERTGRGRARVARCFTPAIVLHERFLLCNGDSLFDCNLSRLLAEAATDGPEVTGGSCCVIWTMPRAMVSSTLNGDRVTAFSERPPPGTSGTDQRRDLPVQSSLIDDLPPACSLEADILPALARAGALRGTVGDGYFRDIGVPRIMPARNPKSRGAASARAVPRPRRRDQRRSRLCRLRDRFEWIDGARDAIRYATEAGWHVFVVTNQSGVARGHFDEAAMPRCRTGLSTRCGEPAARSTTFAIARFIRMRWYRPIGAAVTGASRRPACCWT